jgi:hypothetical protein
MPCAVATTRKASAASDLSLVKWPEGLPRDRFARFHLYKEPMVYRLQANADISPKTGL